MNEWQRLYSWPDVKPCGTTAAYRRHLRHGEKPCESCRQAQRRHRADVEQKYTAVRRVRYAEARARGLSSQQASLYASSPRKYPLEAAA